MNLLQVRESHSSQAVPRCRICGLGEKSFIAVGARPCLNCAPRCRQKLLISVEFAGIVENTPSTR
jgi:hypothetical protein